jgi:nucleotide-binding universal stress UspA family protein
VICTRSVGGRPADSGHRCTTMIAAHKILCPIDFSECSRRALQVAAILAQRTKARVIVLHVAETVNLYPALVSQVEPIQVPHPTRAERASRAAHFVAPFCDLQHTMDVVLSEGEGDLATTIATTIDEQHIDLVVMGTHGRRGFRRLAIGSVAKRVVHAASCPVMVVPPSPAPLPRLPSFERIVSRRAALDLSYARTFAPEAESHVETIPLGEPAADVLRKAAAAGADLIVWNRASRSLDDILSSAIAPVLVVFERVPRSWHARSTEPVPVDRACRL